MVEGNDILRSDLGQFARLRARLDDPYTDRTACLTESQLGEDEYVDLVTVWRARLAKDPLQAKAYAALYQQAAEGCRRKARGEEDDTQAAEDARFFNADAKGFRPEAARVALSAGGPDPVALDPSIQRVLPVTAPQPSSAPVPVTAANAAMPSFLKQPPPVLPSAYASMGTPSSPLGGPAANFLLSQTVDVPLTSPSPVLPPVLPFAATPSPRPASPATLTVPVSAGGAVGGSGLPFKPIGDRPAPEAALTPDGRNLVAGLPFRPSSGSPPGVPPGKRLIRFDPQTGKPLPFPIWVDVEKP